MRIEAQESNREVARGSGQDVGGSGGQVPAFQGGPGRLRAIAEMEARICQDSDKENMCPTWWTESDFGRTLYDRNVVYSVFSKAMEAEKKWHDKLKKEVSKSEDEAERSEKIRDKREKSKQAAE